MFREKRIVHSIVAAIIITILLCLSILPKDALRARISLHSDADSSSEKVAYAIWLSSTTVNEKDTRPEHDPYFLATRILIYQLLHAPTTRTRKNIPVLLLVTPDVDQARRDRLRKDGAKVIEIDHLRPETSWLEPGRDRWADVMSKLRVWQQTSYSRILLLDSDSMIRRPLDAIFDEPSAQPTTSIRAAANVSDQSLIPDRYVLAGLSEVGRDHNYPPAEADFKVATLFNSGFFICAPSQTLFEYYVSILNQPGSFDSTFPEQNLLNYAHRFEGSMPWQRLPTTWNIRAPTQNDIDHGVASVHAKWWRDSSETPKIFEWYKSLRWEMEGYYQAYDEFGPASR